MSFFTICLMVCIGIIFLLFMVIICTCLNRVRLEKQRVNSYNFSKQVVKEMNDANGDLHRVEKHQNKKQVGAVDFDILDEKMLSQTAKLDEAINLYKFQESLDTEGFKKTLQNNANAAYASTSSKLLTDLSLSINNLGKSVVDAETAVDIYTRINDIPALQDSIQSLVDYNEAHAADTIPIQNKNIIIQGDLDTMNMSIQDEIQKNYTSQDDLSAFHFFTDRTYVKMPQVNDKLMTNERMQLLYAPTSKYSAAKDDLQQMQHSLYQYATKNDLKNLVKGRIDDDNYVTLNYLDNYVQQYELLGLIPAKSYDPQFQSLSHSGNTICSRYTGQCIENGGEASSGYTVLAYGQDGAANKTWINGLW